MIHANILKVFVFVVIVFTMTACIPKLGTGGGLKTEEFVDGKIVRGFPAEVPLYKSAVILESYGGSNGWGASFVADDNLAKVFNFYNEALPNLGWDTNVRKHSDTNYIFEIKNDKNQGQVIVNTAADGKKTAITTSIIPR